MKKCKLSGSQTLFLLFQLLNRKKSDGNVCGSFTIHEKVDFEKLEKAINLYVEKNDSIRTKICFSGLGFKQYFEQYKPFKIEIVDVESDEDVIAIENKINHEVFSILNNLLYKVKFFRFKDGHGGVVACMHHIICDAWTIGLAIKEIMGYYGENIENYDSYSYSEYIASETEYKHSKRYSNDKLFWSKMFKESVPPPAILEGDLNQEDPARKSGNIMFTVDKEKMDTINNYCLENKISTCSFFTGVYALYIGKEANLQEFMLDTIVSNRTNYKEKHTSGLFAKTMTLRTKIEDTTFSEYIIAIHKELAKTYKHYKYPTRDILKIARSTDKSVKRLSKIWFSFQNATTGRELSKVPYTTRWTPIESTYLYDILIELYDLDNNGSLKIIYNYLKSKYSPERMTEIHTGIEKIINQVLDNNYSGIREITKISFKDSKPIKK